MTAEATAAFHDSVTETDFSKFLKDMKNRVTQFFTSKTPEDTPKTDPILEAHQTPQIKQLQDPYMQEYMFERFKKALKIANKDVQLEKVKDSIISVMTDRFTGFYTNNPESNAPITQTLGVLKDEDVRKEILKQAVAHHKENTQKTEFVSDMNTGFSAPIRTETAIASTTFQKPEILNLSEWKEKLSPVVENLKDFAETKTGKIATGIASGLALKATFMGVAAAGMTVGAPLGIAAYALGAVGYAHYKNITDEKLQGKPYSAKGFAMNAGLFGVGAAIPFAGEIAEAMPELTEKAATMGASLKGSVASVIDHIKWPSWVPFGGVVSAPEVAPVAETITTETSTDTPSDTTPVMAEETSATDDTVASEPTPEISNLDTALATLGDNPSAQDIKDAAIVEVWNGDRDVGLQMLQMAADDGNRQAIRDLTDLREMGIAPEFDVNNALSNITASTQQGEGLLADALAGSAQAQHDVAIGLLNGSFGLEEKFATGLSLLAESVEAGFPESIKQMNVLIDLGMVDPSILSDEAKSLVGKDAVCFQSTGSCQFSDGLSDDKKAFFKQAFEATQQAGATAEVTTFEGVSNKRAFAMN